MTIAGRLPSGYTVRNLKTGSGIWIDSRDTVPLDDYKGGRLGKGDMLMNLNIIGS